MGVATQCNFLGGWSHRVTGITKCHMIRRVGMLEFESPPYWLWHTGDWESYWALVTTNKMAKHFLPNSLIIEKWARQQISSCYSTDLGFRKLPTAACVNMAYNWDILKVSMGPASCEQYKFPVMPIHEKIYCDYNITFKITNFIPWCSSVLSKMAQSKLRMVVPFALLSSLAYVGVVGCHY